MTHHTLRKILFGLLLIVSALQFSHAAETLKPYILANSPSTNSLNSVVQSTKQQLSDNGFEVIGSYSPYPQATLIVVTNATLKQTAAKSEFGGYGAAIRVGITEVGGNIQVAYNNPRYMANAYRLNGDLGDVSRSLATALGKQQTFGAKNGIEAAELRDWRYMFGMPYFDDQVELNDDRHTTLVKHISDFLAAGKEGLQQVFRIDIPGKQEVLFGVGIAKGSGSDQRVMSTIDKADIRHTPHLPYGLLVSGDSAYMLDAKFRIAISFPDLTMGQFLQINSAPDGIRDSLTLAAGGEIDQDLF